ncbi:hypothetical protein T03_16855 [Trichinella britovi]|uniref:Uncharacterized protein n=1 Tax=Trichinella britovi TaxID=45882 RepID=A0A0V1AMD7_TRIBR|nr:hypothetical protein T03_16855 [Trichinella britovi]
MRITIQDCVHIQNGSRVLYARDTQVQFARRSIVRQ